jgi:FMN-dependent NADH-azoreductase
MSTLLLIQSSLSGEGGQSSLLASQFVSQWTEKNPQGRVITRNLSVDPVPHLTAERLQAFFAPAESRTAEQQAIVAYSDLLIDELNSADVVVLAVPTYNFSVPSVLRAYFDHVARAGVTFRYSANGPEGLIIGKKAYVFITRGGILPDTADTQTPYLRQFLGFIGITDVEVVHAQGLSISADIREKSLDTARHSIAKLLPALEAA